MNENTNLKSLTVKPIGKDESRDIMNELSTFVGKNIKTLHIGARRLGKLCDSGMIIDGIEIFNFGSFWSFKIGDKVHYNHHFTEDEIIRVINALQTLLDAATMEIELSFKLEIVYLNK